MYCKDRKKKPGILNIRLGTKNSIKKIYVVLFTVLILALVAIMAISSVLTVRKITINNAYDSLQAMEKQLINTLDENMRMIDRLLNIVVSDNQLTKSLLNSVRNNEYMKPNVVDGLFYLTSLSINGMKDIYIIGTNGTVLMSTPRTVFDGRELIRQDWYNSIIESDETVFFDKHPGSYVDKDETATCISVGRALKDPVTGKTIGVALVDVYYNMFTNIFYEFNSKPVQMYFFDSRGNQILDMGSGKIGDSLMLSAKENLRKNGVTQYKDTIDGKATFISYRVFADSYSYLSYVHMNELDAGSGPLIVVTLVLAAILSVIGILCASELADLVTKPILSLCDNMNRVQNGDLTAVMDVDRNDEIGMMSKGFNAMVEQILLLIKQNKQEQERLRYAQIKMYHEQIKPHFLYNTLDSIICMVHAGENRKAECMLYALAKFFRFGLSDGDLIVSVTDEIDYTENYLLIQKIRYNETLNYKFDVSKVVRGLYIPKMILQPLVENSIYHGLKQKGGKGIIKITLDDEDGWVYIRVSDTGVGMCKARLEEVNEALRDSLIPENRKKLGVGVLNVNDRLKALYGNNYKMYYESAREQGTTVHIWIPVNDDLNEFKEEFEDD